MQLNDLDKAAFFNSRGIVYTYSRLQEWVFYTSETWLLKIRIYMQFDFSSICLFLEAWLTDF